MRPFPWLLIILCCSWIPVDAACDRPLKALATHWPPYVVEYAQSDGAPQVSGTDVALLVDVLAAVGCDVRFVSLPPERAHAELARGSLDILMAASYVPERLAYARFSLPYRREVIAVLGLQGTKPVGDWREIIAQRRILLVPRYGFYGDTYEAERPGLKQAGLLLPYGSYDSAIGMLKAGRADLVLGDVQALRASAKALDAELNEALLVAHDAPVHFMYSRVTVARETVQHIDRVLAQRQGGMKLSP